MGLYDTIHIPKKFLPLTKKESEFVESEDFQTKSFGQSLLEFRVNEDKMFEFNWRSDESKEIEEDTWEMIPLTDALSFSVHFTNELRRLDLLAVFENGKMKMVKRVICFVEALNMPKPKKVIPKHKPKKSVLELAKEIPKGRYKGLSEIVNQEYEYVKVKKDEK
jgi:hypothetical protein